MPLSRPIHRLKRAARLEARIKSVPLHAALDRVANAEGYASWSLLAARHADTPSPQRLHSSLHPGDMVLIAARPRQGKTVLAIELALAAIAAGRAATIFSLDYTRQDISARLAQVPAPLGQFADRLDMDCSDTIAADHILARLNGPSAGTLAVIDYLQLLDQRRTNPPLQQQVETLSRFARDHDTIFVFVCQIDRTYDPERAAMPGRPDIRLPNPLDLALFNRAWFLQGGKLRMEDHTRG